jgi:hypothetical protein
MPLTRLVHVLTSLTHTFSVVTMKKRKVRAPPSPDREPAITQSQKKANRDQRKDASVSPEQQTITRGQRNVRFAAMDTTEMERSLKRENRLLAPQLKAFCSHCGEHIEFGTYISRFSRHFEHWDDQKGRWSQVKNGQPNVPLPGHDGLSIYTRLQELQQLDRPEVEKVPSHLLAAKFMHGHHNEMDPGNSHYNDESDSEVDSDDDSCCLEILTDEDVNDLCRDGEVNDNEDGDVDPHPSEPSSPAPSSPLPSEVLDVSTFTEPFHFLLRAWKSTSGTTNPDFTTLLKILNTLDSTPKVASDVATTTLHTIDKKLGLDKDMFDSICVCEKCGKLYDLELAEIKVSGETTRSRVCCNLPLLKCDKKSKVWKPVLTYPTVDVETALSSIISRPDLDKLLDHWKSRSLPRGTYGDLYEGDVWREFQTWKGKPFLSESGIALMLNMDGFQPFKRRQYSVQGIYLAIMNLPRHLRYRRENMILVGLVPGGKEKIPLSHFIDRLAKQLKVLWEETSVVLKRRVAMLSVAADVPAGRKLCGIVSHSSPRGCSRCDCCYETEKNPNGGPPKIRWDKPIGAEDGIFPDRKREDHKMASDQWRRAKTKNERNLITKNTGYRWTPFFILEYFDPVRMTVLDPLHNLWEGLFKDLLKQFLQSDEKKVKTLSKKILEEFENEVSTTRFPRSMGPVLGKIGHKMSRFTGHELKNMLNTFFLWLVDDSVTEDQYQLVKHLHEASRIADERVVTDDLIDELDGQLKDYCDLYAKVYGGKALKPNHHFCRHLAGFMRDYGPTCAFWLFAFERYNGIMTSLNTRTSVIETSMFRQYSIHSKLLEGLNASLRGDLQCSANLINRKLNIEELDIVKQLLHGGEVEVLSYTGMDGSDFADYRILSLRNWGAATYFEIRGDEPFPGRLLNPREGFVTKTEAELLRISLSSLHKSPGHTWSVQKDFVIGDIQKFRDLDMCGVIYQSGTTSRMSHVLFKTGETLQPALVRYYCSVEVSMGVSEERKNSVSGFSFDEAKSMSEECPWYGGFKIRLFHFARVDWFPAAPRGTTRTHSQKWSVDLERNPNYAFVPVARIVSGFVPLLGGSTKVFSCGPLRGHLVF